MMPRIVTVCVLALGAAACSLFTPLSGFSSGDDSPGDGGPQLDGANADSGALDGGTIEATSDANNPEPDATTGFCKAQTPVPALCMDFDDASGGPPSGWTPQLKAPGGVERVSSPVRSSPSALRAWVDPAGEVRHAYWARPIGTTVTHARYSYSIFIETRPTTSEVEVNMVRFDAGETQNHFYLALQPNNAEYWEQYNTPLEEKANPVSPSLPIEIGKWHRVSVELNLGLPHSIRITVDNVMLVEKALTQATKPGTVLATSGITWANGNADKAKVVIDDVVFEVLP